MAQNGTLEYTQRAFEIDSREAMQGRIDRALIELITNSDDAYNGSDGPINIYLNAEDNDFEYSIGVYDRATGLLFDEMLKAFTKPGEKVSHLTRGGKSRGLFGRGSKDVSVFGKVVFSAIKDEKFSSLAVFNTMKWQSTEENSPATADHYENLKLNDNENGLAAVIYVAAGNSLLKPKDLVSSLKSNAQLRDLIMSREVNLYDSRPGGFSGRLVCDLPTGTDVLNEVFTIDGYEGQGTLIVRRLTERQTGPIDENSAHGLLIKSESTTFQNTWFSLGNKPAARVLTGELDAPQIVEQLRREIEGKFLGGSSIVTRNRDGLNKDHPLTKSLEQKVTQLVLNLFDEISKENHSEQKQGAELDAALKMAGDVLSPDLTQMLKELDDEMPEPDPIIGLSDFEAIPGVLMVKPGKTSTITLRSISNLISNPLTVVQSDSKDLKIKNLGESNTLAVSWADHPRLQRKVTQCSFTAPEEEGVYSLKFNIGKESSTVQIVVKNSGDPDPVPPLVLEFYPATATSSPKRGKNMVLRAPNEFLGEEIPITGSNLVVDYCPEKVTLVSHKSGQWVQATVHIKTGIAQGELNLTAISSNVNIATAELKVKEVSSQKAPGVKFKINFSGEQDRIERYEIDYTDGVFDLTIFAEHRGFGAVFGKYNSELAKYEREDEPNARAVLAEVIARAISENIVELESVKRPLGKWDASATIRRVSNYSDKLVGKLHSALQIAEQTEGIN